MLRIVDSKGASFDVQRAGVETLRDLRDSLYTHFNFNANSYHFFCNQAQLKEGDPIPEGAEVIAMIHQKMLTEPSKESSKSRFGQQRINPLYIPLDQPEMKIISYPGFCHHSPVSSQEFSNNIFSLDSDNSDSDSSSFLDSDDLSDMSTNDCDSSRFILRLNSMLINNDLEAQFNLGDEEYSSDFIDMDLTARDHEIIERLCNMGFDRSVVLSTYIACDKNEQFAARCLISMR